MTATPSGWESPSAAYDARGPLEDLRTVLERARDFDLAPLVRDTLVNTLAGDRMRRAHADLESALTHVGLALDTIGQ